MCRSLWLLKTSFSLPFKRMYCCVVADMRSTSNLAVTGVHTSSHSGSLKHSSETYCDVRGSIRSSLYCILVYLYLYHLYYLIYWKSEKHQLLTLSLTDNLKSRDANKMSDECMCLLLGEQYKCKYKYKYKHKNKCLMNTCASSLVSTHCLLEAAGRGDWRVPGARAAITTA